MPFWAAEGAPARGVGDYRMASWLVLFVPNSPPRAKYTRDRRTGPGASHAKPRSKDVFAILVREHELRLLAFVRACVADPAGADDIVQETFIAAWWQLARYDRTIHPLGRSLEVEGEEAGEELLFDGGVGDAEDGLTCRWGGDPVFELQIFAFVVQAIDNP